MGSRSKSSTQQTNNSTSNVAVTNNQVSAGGDANNITSRNFIGDFISTDHGSVDAAFDFAGQNNAGLMTLLDSAHGENIALSRDLTDSAFEFAGGAHEANLAFAESAFDTVEDQVMVNAVQNQNVFDFAVGALDRNAISQNQSRAFDMQSLDNAFTFAGEAGDAALLRVDEALAATTSSQTESREDRKVMVGVIAAAGVVTLFALYRGTR